MESEILEVPGARLDVVQWRPSGEPIATVQLVHGMAEHIRRYDHFARRLADAGYWVFGHDHRGHGRSAEHSDVRLGHMGAFRSAVEDIRRVAGHVRGESSLKGALFAHSMGSFMAQELLLDHPDHADAWVLSGTNGKPPAIAAAGRLVARLERWRKKPEVASPLLQKLSFGRFNDGFEGRTEFDWLSRDPDQVDAYIDDPHCGFGVSTETWVGLLDAFGPMSDPYRQRHIPKDLPILLIVGSEDPVSEKSKGVQQLRGAYEAAGLNDVTLRIFEGARHEVLNETNRDEVEGVVMDWLTPHLAAAAR